MELWPTKLMINLIFFLPNFTFGGAGNSIVRLCKSLDNKKYKINIISIGKCAYKNELKNYGFIFYELKKIRLIYLTYALQKIIKKIYSPKFSKTIFISGHHYANIISIISLFFINNIKLILVERTDLEELKIYYNLKKFIKNRIIYFLIKILYKKADLIVSNSKSGKKDLKILCKGNVTNITPPSFLGYEKIYKKKKQKTLRIVTVGRLVREKGIKTMIKAIKKTNLKNITLKILGNGSEKKYLNQLIAKLNLKNNIFLLGHIKNPKKIYLESDLFIHASHFEGFPNSIVEAINYNLPVICSDCKGGTKEIILNGKGGDLFDVGDYKTLAKKIISFYKNPNELKKKLKFSRQNIKKFSLENNVQKYEFIFRTI